MKIYYETLGAVHTHTHTHMYYLKEKKRVAIFCYSINVVNFNNRLLFSKQFHCVY